MNAILDKYDLLNLVKSQCPSYNQLKVFRSYGDLWGKPEHWEWDEKKLETLSDEELWNLYLKLKREASGEKEPSSLNTICKEIILPEHPDAFGARICHECGGIMIPSSRETIFTCPNQNREIKITNIHCHQCESCGEVIYSSPEVKLIESEILKVCKDCKGE